MNTVLEIENLTKIFKPQISLSDIAKLDLKPKPPVVALENISFCLGQGKILGILGPNGAGKTTLLKLISTLILPDKGHINVGGYLVGKDDEKIKSHIGLVTPDERSFYWRLTGAQNLDFFAALYGLEEKEFTSRLKKFYKIFNMDYEHKRFDSYSTGMKRKFALIRALIHEPVLLLLDEPTKSLDYQSALELRDIIKNTSKENKTIILATHNINEIENFCDLFLILHQGKIYGYGTLNELKEETKSKNLTDIYLKLTKND